MILSVAIDGGDRLRRGLADAFAKAAARIELTLAAGAEAIAEEAAAAVLANRDPARSGPSPLAESIKAENADGVHRVIAEALHAVFVEFGTSRMPAEPFLQPAFDRIAADLRRRLASGGAG